MFKLLKLLLLLFIFSCGMAQKKAVVTQKSVKAGSEVRLAGDKINLHKGSLSVGQSFINKANRTDIGFKFNKRVTVINIVPSIDTKVCEEQTHILGETKGLEGIDLVTISRDLPMAQKRFAKEAKLENITYYSDYKTASFGKRTGTLMKGPELLARGVIVLDKDGVIRHLQLVDEVTQLPDMKKAFEVANGLK